MTDQGAFAFAQAMGLPEVPGEKLITERSLNRWKKNLEADWNPQEFQKQVYISVHCWISSCWNKLNTSYDHLKGSHIEDGPELFSYVPEGRTTMVPEGWN